MKMKICTKCKVKKDESEFYKNNGTNDGLTSWCKNCYRVLSKIVCRTDKRKEYQKEYHKEYHKIGKYKKYQKEYRLDNIERIRKYKKDYQAKRRNNDIKHKLDNNICNAICTALKGKKEGRRWKELVGYSLEDLMRHLESKFESWMNWDNYGLGAGKWNIDHIKPRSSFNYTCPEDKEFKECWSLSNLQPMETIENIKKGNKYEINQ